MKLLNCLIILWQIIHNGILKGLLLVKKVNSVEEISSLSEKVDALMKLVTNKIAPIDVRDVPLSTLIEQNSDVIDVNFISRNNFNKNAYGGNFNPRPFPSNSSNNYGNSYGNPSYNNIIGTPLILRIILNNLSMLTKFSMLQWKKS